MTKVRPDLSFVRGGMPLSEWLLRLVADDRRTRISAGEAIEAMAFGVPSIHTDFDELVEMPNLAAHGPAFEAAVKAAVSAPEFPRAEFVRRLCAYRLWLKSDWTRRVDQAEAMREARSPKFDRILERLFRTIHGGASDAAKAIARARLGYVFAAEFSRGVADDEACYEGAESTSQPGIASYRVFQALGAEFLAAPDALAMLLEDDQVRHDALAALTRAGRAAISFAPRLIRRLDDVAEAAKHWRFDGAAALGSVGRGDPGVVEAMLLRLRHDNWRIRTASAAVLTHIGPEMCGREREAVDLLWPMLDRDHESYDALHALASVGRHLPDARRRVIDAARPRPTRLVPMEGFPGHQADAVRYERGAAIDAMRYFACHADECVPVLIEALDTFEEYDPDQGYGGPCARVSAALKQFGAGAAAAALPLARKLEAAGGDYPRCILEALAAMGPAAAEAAPWIDAFRQRYAGDDPLSDLEAEPALEADDLAGWAIQQIRGRRFDGRDT